MTFFQNLLFRWTQFRVNLFSDTRALTRSEIHLLRRYADAVEAEQKTHGETIAALTQPARDFDFWHHLSIDQTHRMPPGFTPEVIEQINRALARTGKLHHGLTDLTALAVKPNVHKALWLTLAELNNLPTKVSNYSDAIAGVTHGLRWDDIRFFLKNPHKNQWDSSYKKLLANVQAFLGDYTFGTLPHSWIVSPETLKDLQKQVQNRQHILAR